MKTLLVSLIVIFSSLFLASSVHALDNTSEKQSVVLPADQTVNHDYFAAGNTVQISGTVNGDAYIAGGQVIVDGTINGDLIAVGGNISVTGKVSGNIRAAGGQVNIEGAVGKNLTLAGGSIDLFTTASIHGNLAMAGGTVAIQTPISGGVNVAAGSLVISNAINGSVDAAVRSLTLSSKARINGDLTYTSQNDATLDSSSQVSGKISKVTPPTPSTADQWSGRAVGRVLGLLSTILVGLLLIRFVPKLSTGVAANISRRPWASLGLGFAALFLTPIAFVILMITVIGIPLGFMLVAAYLVAIYLGIILFTFWVGTLVKEMFGSHINDYLTLIVGATLFWLVTLIPILGAVIGFAALMLGLGAIILTLRVLKPLAS